MHKYKKRNHTKRTAHKTNNANIAFHVFFTIAILAIVGILFLSSLLCYYQSMVSKTASKRAYYSKVAANLMKGIFGMILLGGILHAIIMSIVFKTSVSTMSVTGPTRWTNDVASAVGGYYEYFKIIIIIFLVISAVIFHYTEFIVKQWWVFLQESIVLTVCMIVWTCLIYGMRKPTHEFRWFELFWKCVEIVMLSLFVSVVSELSGWNTIDITSLFHKPDISTTTITGSSSPSHANIIELHAHIKYQIGGFLIFLFGMGFLISMYVLFSSSLVNVETRTLSTTYYQCTLLHKTAPRFQRTTFRETTYWVFGILILEGIAFGITNTGPEIMTRAERCRFYDMPFSFSSGMWLKIMIQSIFIHFILQFLSFYNSFGPNPKHQLPAGERYKITHILSTLFTDMKEFLFHTKT